MSGVSADGTERHQGAADRTIKDIRRQTRKRYSSEEKIRIVLAGLETNIPTGPLTGGWSLLSEREPPGSILDFLEIPVWLTFSNS